MELTQLDWNLLRAFHATAEHGTLSGAARALGLTQPTLSRQIASLEDKLAIMLFERDGRRLSLTGSGRELLSHVQEMGQAANRLALTASGQRSGLKGLVRITASDVSSAHYLPDIVREIRMRAPQITVEIVADDDIRNLLAREADIALRHVRPEHPNLVARLLQSKAGYFFAATSYLNARGRPKNVNDLTQHDWIAMGEVARMHAYMIGMGIPITPENFKSISANGLVAWEMCKAGLGICPMAEDFAVTAPQVERVLPELLNVTYPVWLVTHREIHTSPRIRLVFDMLAEALS
ncbi:LysR substrate binding domain protein [Sulfitobacter noctilucicola]|uniref:DNA-binding transcriptional LysR family regulator n=1 Tax=Sulfitobacter noctilucicola TaxID=1342301 RepID=A0A7W6M6J1_9RHOB|nr:LysR family transcriptional regulator [Sulfitobacter noctilucicola]KIN62431.1 LysR substrate binding domain protein [Sulfitobacter noctilucicola]MBB4173037.1 DNA-binding transcriptional LysR family regulator [Sulfitobacter noctilucicola]